VAGGPPLAHGKLHPYPPVRYGTSCVEFFWHGVRLGQKEYVLDMLT
jgi:hypothetical protein